MRSPTLVFLAQVALAAFSVSANDKTTCGTATTLAPVTNTVLLPEQTISLCDSAVTQCSISIPAIPTVAAASLGSSGSGHGSPSTPGNGHGSPSTPGNGQDGDTNADGRPDATSGEEAASTSRPAAPIDNTGENTPSDGTSPSGEGPPSDGSPPIEGGQPEGGPGANEQPTGDYPGPGGAAPTESNKDVAETPAVVVVSAADGFQRANYMYQLISAVCGLVACYVFVWLA